MDVGNMCLGVAWRVSQENISLKSGLRLKETLGFRWDVADGALLKPAYFERDPYRTEGDDTNVKPIDFLQDCYAPHWKLWNDRIRNAHPLSIAFINPVSQSSLRDRQTFWLTQ